MDNNKNDFKGYIQKIIILQVIQQIFCEMLIGGRKIVYTDTFFGVTNVRTNVQNDSSEFEELLQEMVSKKPFTSGLSVHVQNVLSSMHGPTPMYSGF